MNEPDTTQTHQGHLLDEQGFNTDDGFKSLRNAGGNLGVESIGNDHYVTVYDSEHDTHHRVAEYGAFTSAADAQILIDNHNKQVKSHMIIDERPESSLDEIRQQAINKARRAKERAER